MKRLLTLALTAASISAHAQLNSPGADGYFARGIAMYNDHNYNGCIDQLVQLRSFTITPLQREDAAYYLAMATLHSGDDEAITLLDSFLQLYQASPRYSDVMMSTGDFYFTRGNYTEALKRYESVGPEALDQSRASDLRYRTAYSLMMIADNVRAKAAFSALTSNSEYGNAAKFYIAYIDYESGNYDSALSAFADVDTSKEPGTAAPYYMSQIYFLKGEYSKALNLALKMIESNEVPQFAPEANRIAGESYYNMGHIDYSLPYLWTYAAQAENPKPSTLYILGVSEYDAGHIDEAIGLFQKATKAEGPVGQAAWLKLGQAYVKKNNPDGALLAFEKAYTDGSDRAVTETAFYNYIVARTEGGRLPFAKTVTMLEDFIKQFPRSRYTQEVQESLVNGYMTDGDYESALNAIDRISNPTSEMLQARQRASFELGSRELIAGRPESAARLLRRAADGPSADVARQARLWCADADYALDDLEKAADAYLQYASTATESDPNRTLAYYNLGYTRYKQGRYSDALTDFRRVAAAKPASHMLADAYNRIGDCLYQQHNFSEAADNYSMALSKNEESGDYALYQLSVMRGLEGNQTAKIEAIDRLAANYPSSTLLPAAMLDKAEAYAAIGSTQKSIATYNDIIRQYESSSYGRQAYLQLAITQLNAGNRSDAIDTYKKVIYSYPTSDEARVATDDLKRLYAEDNRLGELTSFLESVPNSPRLTASEIDALAFQAAENMYVNTGKTDGLQAYIADYPHGNYEAQTLFYLADAYAEADQLKKALEYLSDVLLNHPDSEVADDAMLLKADIQSRQGKGETALETYRTLESRAAGSRLINDARLGIMRTALQLGRYSEVLVATDKLKTSTSATSSDLPEIRFSEATALDRLGRKAEAYAIWSELESDANSLSGAKSAVYHAQSQFDDGKTADASKTINRFINLNTPHQYWQARAFILLSDILRRQGRDFEADEYLQALRRNYPGTETDIFKMIDQRSKK